MKLSSSKKTDKKDLILGKIFELKENDFGDISRLQMIQTYLEEGEKVDQEDIAYLKKICKEFAKVRQNNVVEKEQIVETTNEEKIEEKPDGVEPKKEKKIFKFFKKPKKDAKQIEKKEERKTNRGSDTEEKITDQKDQDVSNDELEKFAQSLSESEKNHTVPEKSQIYDFDRDFSKQTNDLEEFQNSQKLELEDIGSIITDIKSKKEGFRKELDRIHAFRNDAKRLLSQYDDTEIKLNSIRSNLDSIQLNVSKQLSEVLALQKDLVYLKDELMTLTKN